MLLPKKINNQKGQVLVIFLLILVIGLALVLSIASRTVIDIRQTTTSDESNRAYYAAESGVEDALKQIKSNPAALPNSGSPYTKNLSSTEQANVETEFLTKPHDTILDFLRYQQDDVAQIYLIKDFQNLNSRTDPASVDVGDTLNLYWGADAESTTFVSFTFTPAIEVSIVTYDGTNWGIKKMTFSNFNTATSNFCTNAVSVNSADSAQYYFKVALKLNSINGCANGNETVSITPILARVRFLNHPSPLGVSLTSATNKDLPRQGQKITSTGFTPSGVSRKLVVNRFYPALPAIFDYVLYNGSGTQDLCKGSCP